MNEWVAGELATVDFSDKRLDKRMRIILGLVGKQAWSQSASGLQGKG